MTQNSKNTIIFGTTYLCSTCIDILINKGWDIIGVVTNDINLAKEMKDKNISVLNGMSEVKEKLDITKCITIFSIINELIIPVQIIEHSSVELAVNYHDSYLPSYAGVNSTAWAIYNEEIEHGVTWHIMDGGIDTGRIIRQSIVSIDTNESVESLNIKCTEKALELFKQFISNIDELKPYHQDTSKRSYFGRAELPRDIACIQPNYNANSISKILRAFYKSEFVENRIISPKVMYQGRLWLVKEYKDDFYHITDLYDWVEMFKIHKSQIEEFTISNTQYETLKNVKKKEYVNSLKVKPQGLRYYSLPTKRHILLKRVPKLSKDLEFYILTISILCNKIIGKDISITLYAPSGDDEVSHFIDYLNWIQPSENETVFELKNKVASFLQSQLELFKEFGFRYSINLTTDIAIYINTNVKESRHPIFINILENEIVIYDATFSKEINAFAEILGLFIKLSSNLDSNETIKNIQILNKEEYQTIVYDWNDTDRDYPKDKTIYKLFEEQVAKTPDNIAVVFEERQLTYKELNEQSNQLARELRMQYQQQTLESLQPDTLIALCLDRSEQMIVAILAALKAGGAYVPLEPSYPEDRIEYILEDTKAPLLLTQSNHTQKLQGIITQAKLPTELIDLHQVDTTSQVKTNLSNHSSATDLAYVIYTSGTTGKPKGACLTHKCLNNLATNQQQFFNLSERSRVLQYSSIIFDASVWEIYSTLISGARLFIGSDNVRKDSSILSQYLDTNMVTLVTLPPVLLSSMTYQELPNLETLIIAGEACSEEVMNLWSQGRRFINAYGPTESTVCATMHEYKPGDLNTNIGKPLANVHVYVLNEHHQPVPVGVTGELYIRGAGLARGYLNRPELTEERFIPNPFASESDIAKGYTRLYKTGDLVRWLPDGNLEYIGRNDFQIKIRGYRIELGEIENTLSTHPEVTQVCVLAKERPGGSDKVVVAYVVPKGVALKNEASGNNISLSLDASFIESLVVHCRVGLPEFMVPAFFVGVSYFPMTVNGKIDKASLQNIEITLHSDEYIAPQTHVQKEICKAIKKVLGSKKIGLKDNFF